MFDKIKALYPNATPLKENNDMDMDKYTWFTSPEGDVIGIPTKDMSSKEASLLETLLSPFHFEKNDREQDWKAWIHNKVLSSNAEFPAKYRFVFFSLEAECIDSSSFQEAIQGLVPTTMPVLWENEYQGMIVEEQFDSTDEPISYDHIIDVLMSDFYMKLHLYMTPFYHEKEDASPAYKWGFHCFQVMLHHKMKSVTTYQDVIPYLYIDTLPHELEKPVVKSLLGDALKDKELLKTIRVFIESNSNATLAAKRLFMHRNSLQYRVDKFMELTSIDVKQFHGALITYLALLQADEIMDN